DRRGSLSSSANSSLRRLCHQPFDRATRGRYSYSPAHLDKHARTRDREVRPEHLYLCENSRAPRSDRHWAFVRLEGGQRCSFSELVGFVEERLESADRAAWFHNRRWACDCVALWQSNGGPTFRPNRLDERDVYWQRSARPG